MADQRTAFARRMTLTPAGFGQNKASMLESGGDVTSVAYADVIDSSVIEAVG